MIVIVYLAPNLILISKAPILQFAHEDPPASKPLGSTCRLIPYPFFGGIYFSIQQILTIKLGFFKKGAGYEPLGRLNLARVCSTAYEAELRTVFSKSFDRTLNEPRVFQLEFGRSDVEGSLLVFYKML